MGTPVKNFAKATVSAGYDAAATTIVLSTGHGARFPDPATEGTFPIAWWNASGFADPADDPNREIVVCTARAGDTLTVVRGQEGTSASTKNTGTTYKMLAGITATMWNQATALSQSFRGLTLSTHPDADLALSRTIFSATAIVMNDGEEVADWTNIVTDLTINGVGGLDTGSEASAVYEQYAIYNGTTKAGCLHRAKDWFLDLDITAGEDATQGIRSAVDNSTVRVAQGFTPVTAGKLVMIEVELIKVGTPTGHIWFTIEANSGGVPSNTPLTTSWKFDVSRIPTTAGGTTMRIPFLVPATVSAATLYHAVAYGDWSVSATSYIGWRMDGSAAAYAGGSKALFDSDTSTWTTDTDDDLWMRVYVERNNVAFSTTVPSGYRYAFIGYAINNASGDLQGFKQHDRQWRSTRPGSSGLIVNETSSGLMMIDLRGFIPAVPEVSVILAVTGTGASAADHFFGDLTCPDIVSGVAPGNHQLALYATIGSEEPQGSGELLVSYAAMYRAGSNGADLYTLGFNW